MWIPFEETRKKRDSRISVTRGATLGFTTAFYEENKIRDYTHVLLFFNPEENAIGISFTTDATGKGKIKISHSRRNYGGSVNAKAFFITNKIDYAKYSGRYTAAKEQFEGKELYVIKLKENTDKQEDVVKEAEPQA